MFDEPFPSDNENLYPGDYLIDFAQNIIKSNKDIDFKNLIGIDNHFFKIYI